MRNLRGPVFFCWKIPNLYDNASKLEIHKNSARRPFKQVPSQSGNQPVVILFLLDLPPWIESRDFWLHVILMHVTDPAMHPNPMPFCGVLLLCYFILSFDWPWGSSLVTSSHFVVNFIVEFIELAVLYPAPMLVGLMQACNSNGLYCCNGFCAFLLHWPGAIFPHYKNPSNVFRVPDILSDLMLSL